MQPEDDDEELARLDESEAPPVEIPDKVTLRAIFGAIDPMPELPLTTVHEAGLATVIARLDQEAKGDSLVRRNVRRIVPRLGNRCSVSVGPDGITVRGLLRRRHTPWTKMSQLTFTATSW